MRHSPAPPLSARQREILMAVVREHIATKAAVGSKQLKEKYGFSVSTATIRNEMAYLEQASYLCQPHTSSGRVPLPEAYRLYVNEMREGPLPEHSEASRIYESECRRLKGRPRTLMRATSRSLAALTGYPSVVMSPSRIQESFEDIAVSPVSSNNLLLTYKTDTGKQVQQLLRSPEPRADRQTEPGAAQDLPRPVHWRAGHRYDHRSGGSSRRLQPARDTTPGAAAGR